MNSLSSLYLDAFFACAQLGHFTKAAARLTITQSALSQRIAKLEEDLGTPLFLRQSKHIQLTPAGHELLQFCLQKESLENDCLDRISGKNKDQLTGNIRIGGFSSIMRSVVLPSLNPLIKENPQLKLTIVSKEIDELPALLKRGEIDYMIQYQEYVTDGLETVLLGEEKNVLVEPKSSNCPDYFLDHDENDQVTSKYLRLFQFHQKYQRRYLDDVYGLIDGVKNGLGRAIIPLHLVKSDKKVKVVSPQKALVFPVILHYYSRPFYSKLHAAIVDSLKLNVKNYL